MTNEDSTLRKQDSQMEAFQQVRATVTGMLVSRAVSPQFTFQAFPKQTGHSVLTLASVAALPSILWQTLSWWALPQITLWKPTVKEGLEFSDKVWPEAERSYFTLTCSFHVHKWATPTQARKGNSIFVESTGDKCTLVLLRVLSKSSTLKHAPLRHTVADGSETSTWDRVRALSCSSRDRLRPSLSSSVGSRALEEQGEGWEWDRR